MKALEYLKKEREIKKHCADVAWGYYDKNIDEAIDELEHILEEKDLLEEYVQFARLNIETYRCNCGSLGRVGYLCSNKECTEQ